MKIHFVILLAIGMCFSSIAQIDDPHKTGNVPIVFYGKVVDQGNRPVPGVTVKVSILQGNENYPTSGYPQQVITNSLATDSDGNFILENVKGSTIQLDSIMKEGYKLSPKQEKRGYRYWPPDSHPDVNNPVIFKMWKMRGAEHLVHSGWHGNIVPDGNEMTFGLKDGKKAKDGDLHITCTRVPLQVVPVEHKKYDYSFQIEIPGGGLVPTEDEFTYLAPESGYLPSITLGAKADDPKWKGIVKQEFYIKTAEGHYGRLLVDWYSDLASPTHFEWNCFINPSGSLNLER